MSRGLCAISSCQFGARVGNPLCPEHWNLVPPVERREVYEAWLSVRTCRSPTEFINDVFRYSAACESATQAVMAKYARALS